MASSSASEGARQTPVSELRATLRTEGFSNSARAQLKSIVEDVMSPAGTWHKGRDPLDLLSLVQLFKMHNFRTYFLQLLMMKAPQDLTDVSMELLADLCRVVLREANNAGDFSSVNALYTVGNAFHVVDGGVRSSMLLNLKYHETWGSPRFLEPRMAALRSL